MFACKVVKREESPGTVGSFLVLALALAVSLGLASLILILDGKSATAGLVGIFQGGMGSLMAIEDSLLKAVPIFLCSLGVALCFRMKVWNIGAEGQYGMGALGATWIALMLPASPAWTVLPLMFLAAAAAGGLWGLIPALLRIKCRANEIILTLMLNYIAVSFMDHMIYNVWKDPGSFGFPMSAEFSPGAVIGAIGQTRLHWGFLFCLAVAVFLSIFLRHTRMGYELKIAGEGVKPARYGHMPYNFLLCFVMSGCGAIAGCAGLIETSAVLNRLQPSVMAGYGYTAIIVAWLAGLRPAFIAVVSLLLAALRVGVDNLQLDLNVPAALGNVIEGLILISILAGQFFNNYKLVRIRGQEKSA